jgi:hypothetical protein
MTTTHTQHSGLVGTRGGQLVATVTPWGDVVPDDESQVLSWHVADEDRWHSPENEASVRQIRRNGTPVVETRMRVHGGDAVQRVYAVASHDGLIVVEVENDSPSPIAVAFTRGDLVTSRPPTQQPIMGITLPEESIIVPIGHRSSIRVALSTQHSGVRDLDSLPGADQLVRGWLQSVEVAGRLVAPDGVLGDLSLALVDARSSLLLGEVCDPLDDPLGTVLDGIELVRMGDKASLWVDELVPLAEKCLENYNTYYRDELANMVAGLQLVLARCGETRAVRDVANSWRKIASRPQRDNETQLTTMSMGRRVAAIEQQFATLRADGSATLFPNGIPVQWRGINVEVYGALAGGDATVSCALRWHGENVAALWEITGTQAVDLRSGVDEAWTNAGAPTGEALWLVKDL